MAISYTRLWDLLQQKGLKQKDLERLANVSHYTVNKLKHGDNLTTDVLERVCVALECSIEDIMEIVPGQTIDIDIVDALQPELIINRE